MESLVNVLESYRGRDKVIRTLCYGSQLVGGVLSKRTGESSQLAKSLLLFSGQLSHCRTVLRLFDDLSMLAYSYTYGLGPPEEDTFLRWMSVMNNVADQLYYPFEHIAWAADAQLLRVRSDRWWTLSVLMWGVSLLLSMLRSLRVVQLLRKNTLMKKACSPETNVSMSTVNTTAHVQQELHEELLSIMGSLADLSNAIHWMPPGLLWAGCSPDWLVGLMGTMSSLIGVYQMCRGKAGGV